MQTLKYTFFFRSLLIIHIVCGFTALFAAFGAILSPKGKYRHRKLGKIFFYAMTLVFITAIPLSIFIHSLFLFFIAIFSYYLAFSGWRYATNRLNPPAILDWIFCILMLVTAIIMLSYGLINFDLNNFKTIVLLIFGGLGLSLSFRDLLYYKRAEPNNTQRIIKHLSAMIGATIAASTAFLVTNFKLSEPLILWLAPTIILVPVIFWWNYKISKHGLP